MGTNLNSLIGEKKELKELRELYSATQAQLDNAVKQGNEALLDLQEDFEKLAKRKRELLQQVDDLEAQYKRLQEKMSYAENTYGQYLSVIKEKRENGKA